MICMKQKLLTQEIKHIDIKDIDTVKLVDAMGDMAFQSRNLHKAAKISEAMVSDTNCSIILCLAGSLVSAGLKQVIIDMIENKMVDVIVSTGAIIVDQDFFEALGYKHFKGTNRIDDELLRVNRIDRIYDTYIDEDNLRNCDDTIRCLADSMVPGVYSSREFIGQMGRYLIEQGSKIPSIVKSAYLNGIPIFAPAFSDSSAGFGLVAHQWDKKENYVSIDSVKDFRELTRIKILAGTTGLFIIGGGVPKNFTQDTVVAADIIGHNVQMHKYAVQITVADERDGALSGSTLKEAHSWGKVEQEYEQMLFCEATIAVPLIVSYLFHKGCYKQRTFKRFADLLDQAK